MYTDKHAIPMTNEAGKTRIEYGWSIASASYRIGLTPDQLMSAIRNGHAQPPKLQHGLRRYYTRNQLAALKASQPLKRLKAHKQRKAKNITILDAAKKLGYSRTNVVWHIRHGDIPAAKDGCGWTPNQFAKAEKFFAKLKELQTTHYHLRDGLRAVGLSDPEITWACHHLQIKPDVVHGKSIRNKWYSEKTLRTIAQTVKKERVPRTRRTK